MLVANRVPKVVVLSLALLLAASVVLLLRPDPEPESTTTLREVPSALSPKPAAAIPEGEAPQVRDPSPESLARPGSAESARPKPALVALNGLVIDDEHQQPIAAATVVARLRNGVEFARTASSGTGRFRFDGLEDQKDVALTVEAPGFVLMTSPTWIRAGTPDEVTLRMRQRPVFGGLVRDESGLGVGCWVELRNGRRRIVVETESDGRFRVEDLPGRLGLGNPLPDRIAAIRVRSAQHRDTYAELTRLQFESGTPFVLDVASGARISGRVLGAGGVPMPGIEILAYPIDGSANAELRSASTAADGSFAFGGLPAGLIRIEPQHSIGELVPALRNVDVDLAERGERSGIEFAYLAGLAIRGRVVNERDDSPLAGMLVTLHHDSWIDPVEARTDSEGQFAFTPLPEGNYRVALRGRSWRDPRGPIAMEATTGRHDLVLRLDEPPRTGAVAIALRERETGSPIVSSAVASVRCFEAGMDQDPADVSFVESPIDDLGTMTIGALGTGSHLVEIRVPGFAQELVSFEIRHAGERVDLEVALDPGIELHGRVVDERGEPIEGARVAAFRDGAFDSTLDPERAVATDRFGHFTLTDVAPKASSVAAIAPGFAGTRLILESERDTRAEIELRLERGTPVRGSVFHRNGAFARQYEIRLSGSVAMQITTTDGYGRFTFDAVESGPFRLLDMDGRVLVSDTHDGHGIDLDIEIQDR